MGYQGIDMEDLTVAIQYPSFGPQHPPRLKAIVDLKPHPNVTVVAMEMFHRDSDYPWNDIEETAEGYTRYTVMSRDSETARKDARYIRDSVCEALSRISPDVVVVNGWGHVESRVSLGWCRRNNCKVVLLSDSVRENRKRYFFLELYKKWLLRGINDGFVAGTPQARYLRYLGILEDNIFWPGSCVVDNDFWSRNSELARSNAEAVRAELGVPKNYFLSVARFLECKNLDSLIRGYARYRQNLKGQSPRGLVLCGAGPEEKKLRELVKDMRVPDVHFLGVRKGHDLAALYALADCFILPSKEFECWGLVVNEAMACGLPVICSKMVGSSEDLVQQGVNGYLFDPDNKRELSLLLSRVVSDERLRSVMGIASREIVAAHSTRIGAVQFWKAVAVSEVL